MSRPTRPRSWRFSRVGRSLVDCAVGHGVSARWDRNADGQCRAVETIWIPDAQVERVEPRSLAGAMLGMEATWMNRG
jgi:hypothetical protein